VQLEIRRRAVEHPARPERAVEVDAVLGQRIREGAPVGVAALVILAAAGVAYMRMTETSSAASEFEIE